MDAERFHDLIHREDYVEIEADKVYHDEHGANDDVVWLSVTEASSGLATAGVYLSRETALHLGRALTRLAAS